MATIKDLPALERLKRARAALITGAPFFGALALSQTLVERPSIETAAVNGKELIYAPDFVSGLSEPQTIGMLAHEVIHIALAHHVRRGGRDSVEWNIACDLAVNPICRDAGFVLPPGALFDSSYAGMGAEEIYAARAAAKSKQQSDDGEESTPSKAGDDGAPAAGDEQAGEDSGDDESADGDGPEGDGDGNGEPGEGDSQGNGSAAPDPARCGGVLDAAQDAPGLAEAAAKAEAMVRQAIAVAASQAGEMPGHLKRIIGELNKPRVSWRDVLNRFVDDAATRALDWNRPNKRFLDSGFFLPGSKADSISTIVTVTDDSGSISDSVLAAFTSEIQAMLDDGRVERLVNVYCDSAVHGVDEYVAGDTVKLTAEGGGGGTRFAPAFEHIAAHYPDAAAIVYLTDLECFGSHFGEAPAMPVLWCVYGGRTAAPFGEVVPLDPFA